MKLFSIAALYFAVVFAVGFVLGTMRVMWLVPLIGSRKSELRELPLMLAAVFFTARWINDRFLAERRDSARLIVGVLALALLLLAELVLGMTLRHLPPRRVFFDRDPVSGAAYYSSLCVFAWMPWILGRFMRRADVR